MTRPMVTVHFAAKAVFILCIAPVCCLAGDEAGRWPSWRGPDGTGTAKDAKPPLTWSNKENVKWKVPIPGRGHGTPIVWGEYVFVTTASPIGEKLPPKMSGRPGAHDNLPVESRFRFSVLAVDRATGRIRWTRHVHEAIPLEGAHRSASLASASSVTDGKYLYAYFGSYGLHCLDFDGTLIWQKQLGKMHSKHGHGEGSSPVLSGNKLVVNWDHEGDSFIVALDTNTGDEVWRRKRSEVTSWSSPIVADVEGTRQVVVCGTDRVRGYDLETGDSIWQCGGMSANIVATPIYADGVLYVGSSYEKRMLMAIELKDARGEITDSAKVLWTRDQRTPYVPSPLWVNGSLYFLAHYQNVMTRVNGRTGEDKPGAMRLGPLGNIYASPVATEDHIFVTDLEGATLVVTEDEVPRPIALNQLNEPVNASLAIVGDQIFIRGDKHLFCIAEDSELPKSQ